MTSRETGLFQEPQHIIKTEVKTGDERRPLGELSNYVVEALPEMLERIQAGNGSIEQISHDADLLVGSIPDSELEALLKARRASISGFYPGHPDRDLAGLDVKTLEAGIVHSGGDAPVALTTLVDTISRSNDQPSILTYEEVIVGDGYGNPKKDPRLFMRGEVGFSNLEFLRGHSLIDTRVRRVNGQVRNAKNFLRLHGRDGIDKARFELERAAVDFEGTLNDLSEYRRSLPKEHFDAFRKYYGEHEKRGLKGPSGAFTETIPVLDLLFAGELLPADHRRYLADNIMYFPRDGRVEMNEAAVEAARGNSLTGLFVQVGRPTELAGPMLEINRFLRRFRGRHYKVVEAQVPQALQAGGKGTAGELPGPFLRGRQETTDEVEVFIKGEL